MDGRWIEDDEGRRRREEEEEAEEEEEKWDAEVVTGTYLEPFVS